MIGMFRAVILSIVSHRTAAQLRWDLHFLKLRVRAALNGTRTAIARRIESSPRPLYLNLGSGPRGIASPHWLNVDGFRDVNVDYLVDLSRALPIPDASLDGIFSEHVQEHFTLEDGIGLLRDCHRVLAAGATVRVVMPDAEKILRTYFDDPALLLGKRTTETGRPMEAVNGWFRQRYEHHCLYDFDLAKHALEAAGFVDVHRAAFGEGISPREMILDDPKYEWESLYVEAVKPA